VIDHYGAAACKIPTPEKKRILLSRKIYEKKLLPMPQQQLMFVWQSTIHG